VPAFQCWKRPRSSVSSYLPTSVPNPRLDPSRAPDTPDSTGTNPALLPGCDSVSRNRTKDLLRSPTAAGALRGSLVLTRDALPMFHGMLSRNEEADTGAQHVRGICLLRQPRLARRSAYNHDVRYARTLPACKGSGPPGLFSYQRLPSSQPILNVPNVTCRDGNLLRHLVPNATCGDRVPGAPFRSERNHEGRTCGVTSIREEEYRRAGAG